MSHTSSSIKASEKKNNNGSIDVELPQDQQPPPIQQQPQTPPNQQYQQQQPAPYMPMQVQQPIQQQQQYQNQQVPTFEYYGQQGFPATYYYATATPNQYGTPTKPVFTPKPVPAAGDVNANTNAEIFNPNASKYQCCCGCCHSKSGAIAIACWEVIVVCGILAGAILCAITGHQYELQGVRDTQLYGYAARYGFSALFDGIGVFFLIIALCSKNHKLLLPYFGCKVIKLIGVLGYTCYTIWYVITEYNRKVKASAEYMNGKYYVNHIIKGDEALKWDERDFVIIIVVSTFVLELIFAIWFMYVVKKCYVYFRDLKLSYQGANVVAHPYNQVAPSVF